MSEITCDEDRELAARNDRLRDRLSEELNGVLLPDDYNVHPNGVYDVLEAAYITQKPFYVIGLCRTPDGGDWSIKVGGWGYEDEFLTSKIDFSDLHGRPSNVLARLDKAGFSMIPGVGKLLVKYIKSFRSPRFIEFDRTGWHEVKPGEGIFVLPERVFGSNGDVPFDLDLLRNSELARAMRPAGSLQDWIDNVAARAKSNPIPMVTLMHSFSAPLRWLLESEFLGIHWRGPSSIGKSITLGMGASVWGCGAPCGGDRPTFVMTWNGTQNSLEGLCHSRNDLLLALDEIGEFSGDMSRFIYMASGGRGKSRMRSDASMRSPYKWRAPLLSTGEKSIEDVIQEDGHRKAKAGQFIRVINVECGSGIFVDTKGEDPETFVNAIREACGQFFATPSISFLEHLFGTVEGKEIEPVNTVELRKRWDTITDALQVPDLHDQQKRVIRRLGVIALAGSLAVDFGILPYTHDEVIAAVASVRDMWLATSSVLSDAARAARDLKEFIEDNLERRIQEYGKGADVVRDRVAFKIRFDGRDMFLFSHVGLRRACGMSNTDEVCRYLADHGLLHQNNKPRYQSRFTPIQEIMMGDEQNGRVYNNGSKISLYAVEAKILDFDFGERKVESPVQPAIPSPPCKANKRVW